MWGSPQNAAVEGTRCRAEPEQTEPEQRHDDGIAQHDRQGVGADVQQGLVERIRGPVGGYPQGETGAQGRDYY